MTADPEPMLDLMGTHEVGKLLGVSRQRASQVAATNPRFPKPVANLACGPVWLADEVRAFAAVPRPTGRPRKTESTTSEPDCANDEKNGCTYSAAECTYGCRWAADELTRLGQEMEQ